MSSIEDLYIRYSHDVLHFLLFMGVKKEQAEDLVQEVFMRVLKTQSGFKGKSSEKTWLYTIAKNIAVDSIFNIIFWEVPAFNLVDPLITSAPVAASIP